MRKTIRIGAGLLVLAGACVAAAQATRPSSRPATEPTRDIRPLVGPATAPSAAGSPATAPAARFSPGDPDELLAGLASPDWHVRRQTLETLVRAGYDAKPFIQDLVSRATDIEARKNALTALTEIDENRILGASLITLHVKDAPPSEVFGEISRQCFAPLPTVPGDLWKREAFAKLTIDVDRKPFWEVVPPILQKLGVDLRPSERGVRLMRSGGMQTQGVGRVQGPFLVVARQIIYSRVRTFGPAGGEQGQFGMNLSIYPEPKIVVLRQSGEVHIDQALDDHGNSLAPKSVGPHVVTHMLGNYYYDGGINLYVPLEYAKHNPGARIATFKATTRLLIQTAVEKVTLPDLTDLQPTTKLVNGMPVTFQEFKKEKNSWKLHVRVTQPNFGGPEWPQLIEGVQSRLQVLDAKGNALDHRGMGSTSNNQVVDLTLTFGRSGATGDPASLVWEVPTAVKQIDVPIEFKDLPLFDTP